MITRVWRTCMFESVEIDNLVVVFVKGEVGNNRETNKDLRSIGFQLFLQQFHRFSRTPPRWGRVRNPKKLGGASVWDWRFLNKKSLFFGVGPGCCSSLIMGYLGICVSICYFLPFEITTKPLFEGIWFCPYSLQACVTNWSYLIWMIVSIRLEKLCDNMLLCNYMVKTNRGTLKVMIWKSFFLQVWGCLLSMLVFRGCILWWYFVWVDNLCKM